MLNTLVNAPGLHDALAVAISGETAGFVVLGRRNLLYTIALNEVLGTIVNYDDNSS